MNICLRVGLLLLATIAPIASTAQNAAVFPRLKEAMALTPDLASGEHLYIQYCSACHKRSGWGSGPREVPTLAGQQEFYILEQLMQFSASERLKVEMHEVVIRPEVAGLQTLRDVSAYAARRPPNPDPDRGNGAGLHAGERIFRQSCTMCHGSDGGGSEEDLIPAVGGQQYGYLLVQLRDIAQGHRAILQPAVTDFVRGLSSAEIEGVADYISRLPAMRQR
jgi:cytochrome c553